MVITNSAMAGATAHSNKLAAEINDRDQKLIAEAGKANIQTLSKRDIAAWREAVRPVWSKFSDQIGEDLISKARASNNS